MDKQEKYEKKKHFVDELCDLINRHSMENDSNTPDFLLAKYLEKCLALYGYIVKERDYWYRKGD